MNDRSIIIKYGNNGIDVSSLLASLFLISIVLVHTSSSVIFVVFRYGIALMCFVYALYIKPRFDSKLLFFVFMTLITGYCNYMIVGNMTILGLAYCMMSPFIAVLLSDDSVRPEHVLVSFYIAVLFVMYGFATKGLSSPIFHDASNNYVSVYLLFIITIYYSLVEKNNCTIKCSHMLICWVICLLAQGRGGIVAASFMLVMLFAIKYWNNIQSSVSRIMRYGVIVVCIGVIGFVALNIDALINISFMEHFLNNGMDSNGRLAIWSSYIQESMNSTQNLLFGTNTSDVPLLIQFKGDMHNAFLALHAFNGLFYLCYILVLCVISGINSIKDKRWVFLICFLCICLRGMTDKIFWGSAAGAPVFLFFLLSDRIATKK